MTKTDSEIAAEVAAEKAEIGLPADVKEDEPQGEEILAPQEQKPEEKIDDTKPAPITDEKDEDNKPFNFKEYKKTLRAELQSDFDKKLETIKQEFSKNKPDETKTDNLEADIEALAKELNFDTDKTRKIIEVARKGLEATPEEKELLAKTTKELEALRSEKEVKEQEEVFNTEWTEISKTLKAQFPNASEAQIQFAKDRMEDLAFSEKYHEKEMDYILFKEMGEFQKILFSPKQKTFETGRTYDANDNEDIPAPTAENLAEMTPAQFEAYEKRLDSQHSNTPKQKLRITTRDDRGRMVDRYENA